MKLTIERKSVDKLPLLFIVLQQADFTHFVGSFVIYFGEIIPGRGEQTPVQVFEGHSHVRVIAALILAAQIELLMQPLRQSSLQSCKRLVLGHIDKDYPGWKTIKIAQSKPKRRKSAGQLFNFPNYIR